MSYCYLFKANPDSCCEPHSEVIGEHIERPFGAIEPEQIISACIEPITLQSLELKYAGKSITLWFDGELPPVASTDDQYALNAAALGCVLPLPGAVIMTGKIECDGFIQNPPFGYRVAKKLFKRCFYRL